MQEMLSVTVALLKDYLQRSPHIKLLNLLFLSSISINFEHLDVGLATKNCDPLVTSVFSDRGGTKWSCKHDQVSRTRKWKLARIFQLLPASFY